MLSSEKITAFYDAMLADLGPQEWWPGETPFEVIVGAILTQNTNWTNVERAVENLKREGLLDPPKLHAVEPERLAEVIRPAGYFRVKARRLKNLVRMLVEEYEGDLEALFQLSTDELRQALLAVKGIGAETADSIVLYAAERPVFVVDAYTARILFRHGIIDEGETSYEAIQELMSSSFPADAEMMNDYHALLVAVGKRWCKKRVPKCSGCPLERYLEAGQPVVPEW